MNLEDLKKELPYKWRVQSTKYGKTTCVAYIDARDCQDLLDEVVGPERWQTIFYEENGLLFCKVGIMCPKWSAQFRHFVPFYHVMAPFLRHFGYFGFAF